MKINHFSLLLRHKPAIS